MRESRRKMSDSNDSSTIKHVKKFNRLSMNRKKVRVNKKTSDDNIATDVDTDSGDMQSTRTCDSPVKSEYSEEGSGTDLSASSSVTGGNGSQSSGSRSNQSPSTSKKSGIPGITFQPGTRLEAKDLGNGIWYAVKVVEVDWEEEEILIHFEKWSQRYDEWVPMDSSRLRPVMEPPGGFVKKVAKIFKIGDKVMATWSDSRKYPATVKTVLGNDKYEVLFFDGFSKTIKGGRMIPLKDEELAKIQKLQPGIGPSNDVTNSPPVITDSMSRMLNSPMAAALGTKEERRERKRKLNVAELFHFKKRPRLDSPSTQSSLENNKKTQRGAKFGNRGGRKKAQWPHEISTLAVDSSSLVQVKIESQDPEMPDEKHLEKMEETQTMENRKRENITKGRGRSKIRDDSEKTMKRSKSDALTEEEGRTGGGKKTRRKFAKFREGGKRVLAVSQVKKEKGLEDSDLQRGRKKEGDGDNGKPARVTDDWEPVGEPAYIIDGTDGPRKSIIVADPRIPPGWTRHTIQRMSGHSAGKWDVFFVSPEGRKFRTRHELRMYYEERGEIFPSEQFDFSLGRRKNKTATETSIADSTSTITGGASNPTKMVRQTTPGSTHLNLTPALNESSNETPVRRVKTLLPRVRPPNIDVVLPVQHVSSGSDHLENHSTISDGSVVLGGLKIQKENDAFRCPKEGCNKNFRKENLLQMHMKHYHPEYNRFVASTPNVADLAYARTVGERLDEIHPRTPRPSILEKISRFEALRRARANPTDCGPSSPSLPSLTPSDSSVISLSPLTSVTSRTSPVSSHRRIGDADPLDGPLIPENSGAVMSPCSPPNVDHGETPQSAVRTLMPMVRVTAADVPVQGASNDVGGIAIPSCVGQGEIKTQPTEVSQELAEKMEEREGDSPASLSVAGISHTKSLRMVRRRHMSDFHMEPLQRKRKSDAEESSQNAAVNGNISRQTRTESLRREELINCTCGYPEEDGLMIQCDLCMCWQHGLCNNIEHEDHVPEKYVCYICQNPPRERRSKHFLHDQDWLKEGRLPSLSFRSKNALETAQRENMFKHSHELTGSLLELQNVIHSLRVKVNIAEKKDHPKLYLWAHSWEKNENNSQNQSLMDIHGNQNDDPSLTKNKLEDDTNKILKQKDASENPQSQSNFSLPSYDSTLNLVEANEIGLPTESLDLLADECDTKDTCFSQETSGSTKECSNVQSEEKSIVETKLKAPQLTEGVVLDNNIDIGTETEVATAEVEVGQGGEESSEVKEENMDGAEIKKSESSTQEQLEHASPKEENCTNFPLESKLSNSSKMETEDIDDEDDELQLSSCQNGLIDTPSTENPISSMNIAGENGPLKKFVPCIPQPEAPIDPAECRLTLLDHIDHLQHKVEARLMSIESQIEELENTDPSMAHEPISDARTKETVQMLLRDLAALYDIAAFN